jgi:hypothetical protein
MEFACFVCLFVTEKKRSSPDKKDLKKEDS